MAQKITALVFGLLALALEVGLLLVSPTVEAAVAAAFAAIIVVSMIVLIIKDKKNTVIISDTLPKDFRANSRVMKLSNEIAPYIKVKNGRIYLKILKK